jgi:hypothetical protein
MSGYFWIIFSTVIALSVGFVSGYWISRKNRLEDLSNFRDGLDKASRKLSQIEQSLLPSNRPRVSNKGYVAVPDSPERFSGDLLALNDQLERITRLLTRGGWEDKRESQSTAMIENGSEDEQLSQADNLHSLEPSPVLESDPFTPASESEKYTFNSRSSFQEPYARIVQLYNLGADDRTARDRFRREYSITRIGNNKAVEQRLGEVAKPEFRKLDNGNFLAVPRAQGLFYVLPWFDSTLNSSAYNEGGVGHVFVCPGYNPETAYTVLRVKRPAIFRQDGETWTTVEKGELILQR